MDVSFSSESQNLLQVIKMLHASFYTSLLTSHHTVLLALIRTCNVITADRKWAQNFKALEVLCPKQGKTITGKGWRWKAPLLFRCWPSLTIKQKAWFKLTLVKEIAAQSPLWIFVPVWSTIKTSLLNFRCTYLLVQRPPWNRMILTYESLILFTQENMKSTAFRRCVRNFSYEMIEYFKTSFHI